MRRVALLLVPLVACSVDSAEPPIGRQASAIINGKDSTAAQDAVVLIMHYDALVKGGGTEGCTGIMLTPELVLTARHCVAVTDGSASCSSDGNAITGGGVKSDFKPSALYVFGGAQRPDFISGLGKAARGKELITTGVDNICNNDVALILLDKPLEETKIAPVRLDAPAALKGEIVTVVGWGITTTATYPATRQTRDGVKVIEVGPARNLGPAEFKTGEATCSGDSGGPALAADTGAVMGVLSRGGNGIKDATGADACIDGENVFISAAAHRETILSAYAKTGQDPWFEGNPNPRLGKLGAQCAVDDACQSALCNPEAKVCTQSCATDGCPGGWACSDVSGRRLCVEQKEEDGGCNVSSSRTTTTTSNGWLLALTACAVVRASRKKRCTLSIRMR